MKLLRGERFARGLRAQPLGRETSWAMGKYLTEERAVVMKSVTSPIDSRLAG